MAGRRKAAHVAADFREDDHRAQKADAGDRAEKPDQGSKGGLLRAFASSSMRATDASTRRSISTIAASKRVVLLQIQPEQEAVMIGQPAVQGVVQFLRATP